MFFEEGLAPAIQNETALVVTKTITYIATVMLPLPTTVTATATVTAMIPHPKTILEAPRYPAGDSIFCILFAILCIVLTVAVVLRKRSKKLKAFNAPLIFGAFCIPFSLYFDHTDLSQCIGMFPPCRLPVRQKEGRSSEINPSYPYAGSNILFHVPFHHAS